MSEHQDKNAQQPQIPDWLRRYDISVGPYDQPRDSYERHDDRSEHESCAEQQKPRVPKAG